MIALTLTTLVSTVLSQAFYITEPTGGSWFAGKSAVIKWQSAQAPNIAAQIIQIELVNGDSNNANFVTMITYNFPAKSTELTWPVPADLEPKDDYFLRMSGTSATGEKAYNFSARFKISGGSGSPKSPTGAKNSTISKKPKSLDDEDSEGEEDDGDSTSGPDNATRGRTGRAASDASRSVACAGAFLISLSAIMVM